MTTATLIQSADPLPVIRRLADEGDILHAADLCEQFVRNQPGCIDARMLAATFALSLGHPNDALDHLDATAWYLQYKADDPQHEHTIEQLLLRGKALMQLSRPEDACVVWRQVLTLNPRHPLALRLLAGAHEQLEHYDQAVAYLEHLLLTLRAGPFRPGDFDHETGDLKLLADLCERAGQHARALSVIERFAMTDQPDMQQQMIRLLRHADRKHEAMDRLADLCRQSPDDLNLALDAAELAGELGHESLMAAHAQRAMHDPAAHHGALAALATHAQHIGRITRAGHLWWRLARQSADHRPRALAHLAACAAISGRDRLAARASGQLRRLVDLAQHESLLSAAWLELTPARVLLEQSQTSTTTSGSGGVDGSVLSMLLDESAAVLEQRAEDKSGYADVHHHLSVCQWHLGHADQAAVNSDRALHINSAYADAALLRAQMLVAEGAIDGALAVLTAALDRKPDHVELSAMAGALEVMTNRWKQALARLAGEEHRPQLRQRIAQWLEELGRDSEAIQWRNAA